MTDAGSSRPDRSGGTGRVGGAGVPGGDTAGLVPRVLAAVRRIPPGRVLPYGDLARIAGAPDARTVGQIMNAAGHDTPWWRVPLADGTLAPHLRDRQLALLREENTPLTPGGDAIDMRRARWVEGLEAAGVATDADAPQLSLFDE